MRLIALLLTLCTATPALACGPETDCVVGGRTYRLALPQGATGPLPVLIHAHGYRGTAAGAMNNAALRDLATDLGMALIALQSDGDDWNLAQRPNEPGQAQAREYGYVADVLDDAARRFDLDGTRVVMTGFSAGGMMTWTLACGMSDRFAGFVPMSGTFWGDIPVTCPTPTATVIHIHGTADSTVPMTGRAIGPTRQGDVGQALAMYAAKGGFAAVDAVAGPGGMTCDRQANADGKRLEKCLFDGGHSWSATRLRYGIGRVLDAG